jgi:hypothetical protein
VSATRGVEVVADGTNVLALECALRRRGTRGGRGSAPVKLAASIRAVRAQQFEGARSFAHFRLLNLCTAGRDTGASHFVADSLAEHVAIQLRALRAFLGGQMPLRVALTDLGTHESSEPWTERVIGALRSHDHDAEVVIDQARESGRGYYRSACFKLFARVADDWIDIGDGGDVDWTAKLLSDRRERLFISGVGSERVAALQRETSGA